MSHFAVVVIGENPEEQLAPFHEFECTGRIDQYVQDVDVTEQRRREYEESTTRVYRSAKGLIVDAYDERFFREPTAEEQAILGQTPFGDLPDKQVWRQDWRDGRGYRPKVRVVPDGWEDIRIPTSDLLDFKQYLEQEEIPFLTFGEKPDINGKHKFNYIILDENGEISKAIRRTNPNSKWDWYVEGGRWKGFFLLKDGRKVNQCCVGDVDFDTEAENAEREARQKFRGWEALVKKHGKPRAWSEYRAELEKLDPESQEHSDLLKQSRIEYRRQGAIAESEFIFDCPADHYGFDEEAYVAREVARAFVPYAIVKDSKWHARGEMGWFGLSSDEVSTEDWNQQVHRLYQDLPPDTLLTIIDCHT